MRQHRGNEVFIAANLKLRVVKYEYICHFYFFYKANILQLNLTIQQRLGVGNSPPLRLTCFEIKYISRLKLYLYKKLTQGGPPLLSQRGRNTICFYVLGFCEYNCGDAKPILPTRREGDHSLIKLLL